MVSTQSNSTQEEQNSIAAQGPTESDYASDAHEQATDAYQKHDQAAAESDLASSGGEHTPADEDSTDRHAETAVHHDEEYVDELADDAEDEDEDGAHISLKGRRVLLIEDDDEFAAGITEYLKELGIGEVLLARNAEAGLSYLADRETFPHIVLLELALIGMDGIQFLAQLRASKHKRLQNLPAVVITMLDNPSIYRRAANQKVGAFLRKPVAVPALRDGLQAALRGDIVEKPFSQPKSWLDDVDEEELRAKQEANIAKASAKAQKQGFLVRLLNALIPWSGKA